MENVRSHDEATELGDLAELDVSLFAERLPSRSALRMLPAREKKSCGGVSPSRQRCDARRVVPGDSNEKARFPALSFSEVGDAVYEGYFSLS